MKIAVPTDAGQVSAHFGRCSEYTIAEVEDNSVKNIQTVANPGHEPGRIPVFLKGLGVSAIITGGMGRRALALFDEMEIKYYLGVVGPVDQVLSDYANGKLVVGESLCSPQHLHEGGGQDCGGH